MRTLQCSQRVRAPKVLTQHEGKVTLLDYTFLILLKSFSVTIFNLKEAKFEEKKQIVSTFIEI